MKTNSIFLIYLLLGITLFSCSENKTTEEKPAEVVMTPEMKVKRGEYLVNAMGCDDCHSPKIMGPRGPQVDPKLRFSGHPANQALAPINDQSILKDYAVFSMGLTAATGPWGTSFAANLTPDDTGIGNWTEEQFFKAIREGKSKGLDGARPLLPPMPWTSYRNLNDEDLSAIFAYLKSVTPVNNAVPAPIPPAGM
ncbi:MAG: c-type cytochrome [Bacteroidetes bacterium]|nr:c-type cytochrome [Bacteroidota bacterium]